MRIITSLLLSTVGLSLWTAAAYAQVGPDNTPMVEPGTESMRYVEASTPQLLTQYWPVMYEIDQYPRFPSPDQTKGSDLRKRILDLRLLMDVYAFAYEPGLFEAYRDAADNAYEQVGLYKDLFDIQAIDKLPIDETYSAERLAKMNVALAPFRYGDFRNDLNDFLYHRQGQPLNLEQRNQPRLWQIANARPDDSLDAAGNAARLGALVIRNLSAQGLTVDNIVDEKQEAHFHDIRKALRSVMVMSDMFPSLSNATTADRDGLASIVKVYGQTNDQFAAYHLSQLLGRDLGPRIADLQDTYGRAVGTVNQVVSGGQLNSYAAKLEAVQNSHHR
ncbi:MAG TPA: hypothetical protein VHX16_17985 [Chloroflexota bacterium]|jgi:hypothetical protein|nr:hypothetical protein [Chloroflexota bacterium]